MDRAGVDVWAGGTYGRMIESETGKGTVGYVRRRAGIWREGQEGREGEGKSGEGGRNGAES